MDNEHRDHDNIRSARVLDPAYVEAIGTRTIDELRAMHSECHELEAEVSYVRRLAQARIDIVEAELARRAEGRSLEDLIRALPEILSDSGPRGNPADSRLPMPMVPTQDSEWAEHLEGYEAQLANLPVLSDDALRDAVSGLRTLEREVSDQRRELHEVIDKIDLALAGHLRTAAP
jgi:hypothetical protein